MKIFFSILLLGLRSIQGIRESYPLYRTLQGERLSDEQILRGQERPPLQLPVPPAGVQCKWEPVSCRNQVLQASGLRSWSTFSVHNTAHRDFGNVDIGLVMCPVIGFAM